MTGTRYHYFASWFNAIMAEGLEARIPFVGITFYVCLKRLIQEINWWDK